MENGFANPLSSHRKRRAVGYFRTMTVETGIGKQLATKLVNLPFILLDKRSDPAGQYVENWLHNVRPLLAVLNTMIQRCQIIHNCLGRAYIRYFDIKTISTIIFITELSVLSINTRNMIQNPAVPLILGQLLDKSLKSAIIRRNPLAAYYKNMPFGSHFDRFGLFSQHSDRPAINSYCCRNVTV